MGLVTEGAAALRLVSHGDFGGWTLGRLWTYLWTDPEPMTDLQGSSISYGDTMAEGVGFEPTVRFHVHTLSKRAP